MTQVHAQLDWLRQVTHAGNGTQLFRLSFRLHNGGSGRAFCSGTNLLLESANGARQYFGPLRMPSGTHSGLLRVEGLKRSQLYTFKEGIKEGKK